MERDDATTMSIVLVRVLVRGLTPEAGNQLLDELGITPVLLADEAARISRELGVQAWARAPQLTDDPLFGLRLGSELPFGAYGALELLFRSSHSLHEGLERFGTYYRILAGRDAVALERADGRATVVYRPDHHNRHVTECFVASVCRVGRELWPNLAPLEAHFDHEAAAPAASYETILRIPVRFGETATRIVFDQAQLERVLPATERQVRAAVEQAPDDAAGQLTKLRLEIEARLPAGECTEESVANRVGLGARTLRRRLAEVGTTFTQLVDETRRDLAQRHLAKSALSVYEIALLVGFSDQRAFARAFKRWTGMSPIEYRDAVTR